MSDAQWTSFFSIVIMAFRAGKQSNMLVNRMRISVWTDFFQFVRAFVGWKLNSCFTGTEGMSERRLRARRLCRITVLQRQGNCRWFKIERIKFKECGKNAEWQEILSQLNRGGGNDPVLYTLILFNEGRHAAYFNTLIWDGRSLWSFKNNIVQANTSTGYIECCNCTNVFHLLIKLQTQTAAGFISQKKNTFSW